MMKQHWSFDSAFTLFLLFVFGVVGCVPVQKDNLKTLYLEEAYRIRGLDPLFAGDSYISVQVGRVYDGLLEYHYLKRPYELVPALAEALPEVSEDGKKYVFKLKKGVFFQDDPCFKSTQGKGREVVAQDVVYSILRHADPKLNSTGWWIFDGKVVGLNEWREQAAHKGIADYGQTIEGLRVLDSSTVQIILKNRSVSFIYAMAMPLTSVVPREAVEYYGSNFANHPVGTGAFRVEEFSHNNKIVFVKNPTYRKDLFPSEGGAVDRQEGLLEDAGKPLPLVDRIVVQVYEESQPMWLNFLAGKLDRSAVPKEHYLDVVNLSKELKPEYKSKGYRLSKSPLLDVTHIGFNMEDPVLGSNKLLRQALSLAYDQEKFIEIFFTNRALPAQGPIPPGLEGYDSQYKNPYRRFNMAKAKEKLAQAGFPEGKGLPVLRFMTMTDTTSRQIGEYLIQMFKSIGVKVEVEAFSWPEFSAALRNKKAQMWSQAWSADYPDAENFLQLFYSKNISPGPNDSNYSNPEYDRLYEQALLTAYAADRIKLYKRMVEIVVEDCPWIFGVHRMGFKLTQPWFKNFKQHDFDHGAAKFYKIDKKK